jgi:hypothetical protein
MRRRERSPRKGRAAHAALVFVSENGKTLCENSNSAFFISALAFSPEKGKKICEKDILNGCRAGWKLSRRGLLILL